MQGGSMPSKQKILEDQRQQHRDLVGNNAGILQNPSAR